MARVKIVDRRDTHQLSGMRLISRCSLMGEVCSRNTFGSCTSSMVSIPHLAPAMDVPDVTKVQSFGSILGNCTLMTPSTTRPSMPLRHLMISSRCSRIDSTSPRLLSQRLIMLPINTAVQQSHLSSPRARFKPMGLSSKASWIGYVLGWPRSTPALANRLCLMTCLPASQVM